jgi:two-component system, NtrC family, nitrogen regulation sensor histidine kinase NtrY
MRRVLSRIVDRLRDPQARWTAAVALLLFAGLSGFFLQRLEAFGKGAPAGANLFLFLLINVNVVLLTLLVFLFVRNLIKLVAEGKRRVFGTRLRGKLVAIFIGFTAIPVLLLFFTARGIVNDSVSYWFSPEIEKAIEGAVSLSGDFYQVMGTRAQAAARQAAVLAADPRSDAESIRRELDLAALEVFSPEGRLIARAWDGASPDEATPHDSDLVRGARSGAPSSRSFRAGRGEFIRGAAPLAGGAVAVVSLWLPEELGAKSEMLARAYRAYTEAKLLKSPFKTNYIVYLLLLSFLILFSASWLGFYFARQITVPLGNLAEGAEKVAGGDLSVRVEEGARDEVGTLVRSFNRMTERLEEARSALSLANEGLAVASHENEKKRLYIEGVLRNVGTGVVTFDPAGRISTFNPAAEEMFGTAAEAVLGKVYSEVLSPEHARLVAAILRELPRRRGRSLAREVPIIVGGSPLILHLVVGALTDHEGNPAGTVLVVEDMTKLVHAQREAAWSEVARRVAHEIKNPLTPIKLSAERLARKLGGTLGGEREAMLGEATGAIVREVESIRRLVDEFARFARMPVLTLTRGRLNDTVEEAAALYRGDRSLPGEGVRLDLAGDLPEIPYDAGQVRRVIVNLLDNARQAVAAKGSGEVSVSTRFLAGEGVVAVAVADSGGGVPAELADRIFEPYFSTREGGTGLGLAIAQRVVEEHGGRITYQRNRPEGSVFTLTIPVGIEPGARSSGSGGEKA